MAVYFVRAGESGPVKIGRAEDVPMRLTMLQCGCPEELVLIRTADGGARSEAWFHRRFAEQRIRAGGEWFHFHPDMLTVTPTEALIEAPEETSGDADLIDALGGSLAVSVALGVKPNVVGNWRSRGIAWRFKPAFADLAKELGVELPPGFLSPAKPRRRAA